MNKKAKALMLNLVCFGLLFILIRTIIGTFLPMSYILLIVISALLASVFSPKFMVQNDTLYIKIPLVKEPRKL